MQSSTLSDAQLPKPDFNYNLRKFVLKWTFPSFSFFLNSKCPRYEFTTRIHELLKRMSVHE